MCLQRFTLPEISPYISLLPLLLWVVNALNTTKKAGLELIVISSLATTDLGGGAYEETSFALRFILYVVMLLFILNSVSRIDKKKFVLSLIIVTLIAINTICHQPNYTGYQFSRDLLTLTLAILVVNLCPSRDLQISPQSLIIFSIGMIVSELLNILFFYSQDSGFYLNYSSLKFVVCAPVISILAFNKKCKSLIYMLPITLLIISSYMSRMLMLTFLLICLIVPIRSMAKHISILMISLLLLFFAIFFFEISLPEIKSNRVLDMLNHFSQNDSLTSLLESLDPVRYVENTLFFSQHHTEVLFGRGLGAGLQDPSQMLASIADDGSSFTAEELGSSIYFVLHDSWLWFGLRFGILVYVILCCWAIWQCFAESDSRRFWSAMFLLALLNSSFSIIGLFISAVFAIQLIMSRDHESEVRKRNICYF